MQKITNEEARALVAMLAVVRKKELTLREENRLRRGIAAIKHLQRRLKT